MKRLGTPSSIASVGALALVLSGLTSIGCTETARQDSDVAALGDTVDARDVDDAAAETSDTTGVDEVVADVEPHETTGSDVTADVGDSADPDGGDAVEPDPWSAPGPFRVGYRKDALTYEPADGSGTRALTLAIWYPTRDTEGDAVSYFSILPAPDVLGGADPADDLGARPLVVFSHGNTSFSEQSSFFTEHLATHGYVVVAPDHTGNLFGDSFDAALFHWRPDDVVAVLDHMDALAEGDALAPLMGGKVAVTGHSFGGYTTLALGGAAWAVDAILAFCESGALPLGACGALEAHTDLYRAGFADARVAALIPMTPGLTRVFGEAGVAAITLPTMLMTGALDKTTTNAADGDPTWAQLATRPDNLRLDFATGGHFTFSDACAFPVEIGLGDGCGDGFITAADAHRAINAYALAFLRRHLEDDERGAPLLDGSVTIEPTVTVTRGELP
ncbi:MAG: alpha/beta fold hydrolase [Deltaproteobacteria bacterium]|nr:alpha/beta fold hydrolase [Deltaproteobacteria bacterium]